MEVRKRSMKIGIGIIIFFLIMFLISLFYTPYDPNEINSSIKFMPPSSKHIFGTDNFGRDIFSRIMEGSKTTFIVSFGAVFLSLFFGLLIGGISGYMGRYVDEVLMRFIDALMSIPGILFAIMLVSISGPGVKNTIIALGVMGIPYFSRVSRSGFLQIKKMDYVKASNAKGAKGLHIALFHIIPNILEQLIVAVTLSLSTTIISEAGLSYLGLGVQPPNPSWGRMLKESQAYFYKAPWYFIFTGLTLTLMVFGFTLLADGLRDRRIKRAGK
ncbi:ABC transporter permease [Anaerosphaera multitolerans]|uniref:ABC transporter permease n=1 Tax=Anaerosphaera multitolerans TaxID=2487351 RepID=A0A437S9G0_9FIRM|nr:ABC transporter permease [Anaerosphaera multitolerans]RVU55531.1 ABC transporter permease [Anaerosphaera multitolerans]